MELEQVGTRRQIEIARELFQAYARGLAFDLGFQGFGEELAGLPGAYVPPQGRLLLARLEGRVAGCVALKPLSERVCEMKRLFITPDFRGRGLGKTLAEAIIAEARQIGYNEIRLDSLPTMHSAQALYRGLGFETISPYYDTPVEGTVFLGLRLREQ